MASIARHLLNTCCETDDVYSTGHYWADSSFLCYAYLIFLLNTNLPNELNIEIKYVK